MRTAAWLFAVSIFGASLAQADDSCLVRGRILDHAGRPLSRARVVPIVPGARSTVPDREGRFALEVPCGCARVLSVEGVHHQDLMIPVLPESGRPLELEARLRPLEWDARFDSVQVIGEFNRYAPEGAVSMVRRRDGTFAATIPCETESLRYQLLGVAQDGLPTAGTMADTLFLRRGRGMSSIRAGRKPVEVIFDPRRLPRARRDAVVRFADARGPSAAVFPLFLDDAREDDRVGRAYEAHVAAGGDRDSFRSDMSGYLGSLQRRIPRERDPVRRQFLLLNYVRHAGADSLVLRRALDEIPPESPLWGLSPGGPEGPLGMIRRATGRSRQVREYAEKGSGTNPDREVRAGFLSAAMSEAEASGDKDRLGRYTTRMLEEFHGTFHAEISGKRDAPDRKVRPGAAIADFAFSALEDSSQVIRIADFRGRHLLIDFWAVWCGPCRAEMPTLHRVREAFGEGSLVMVSVSFDQRRADVAVYRRGKWAMPWLHAFASEGFAGKESAAFDVWAIPKAILVAPDGTIVAEGNELRGERLHQTLTRVIGEPGGTPGK